MALDVHFKESEIPRLRVGLVFIQRFPYPPKHPAYIFPVWAFQKRADLSGYWPLGADCAPP